jgi:subtilase family serine protease
MIIAQDEREARRMMRKVVLAVAVLLLGLSIGLVGQGMEEYAELHVTKITLDPPSTVIRGAQVEVHARVMNTGTRSADRFDIGFFYRLQGRSGSWILLDKVEGANLAPSQQDFLDVTFNMDTLDMELGTYEIRIVADLTDEIPEVDELNNELRTTMTLVSSSLGLPDLQPVELVYASTNPGSDDDMLPWNVTTSITNLGEEQAGPFSVVFLIDGTELTRPCPFPEGYPKSDHTWHRALWWSWKAINGINFWEQNQPGTDPVEVRFTAPGYEEERQARKIILIPSGRF